MKKNYTIGLDIGTTSVGWAVVEENTQKIMKKNGTSLWGVRLFGEATTAEKRRSFRSTRRRYDRRRERIRLLQEEFKEEIEKVDKNFFKLLQESKYNKNDKRNKTISSLSEKDQNLRLYQKKYPTIYHLRKKLIEKSDKEDIRLVYLAIHHIIKYRGNFLYENSSFNIKELSITNKLMEIFDNLINTLPELNIPEDYKEIIDLEEIERILLLPIKNDIKVKIKEIMSECTTNVFANEFSKMIIGNKFNASKMLLLEEDDKKIELSFSGTDYDDKYEEYEQNLGEKIEIIDLFKQLYDAIFLKKIFRGNKNTSISSLMVEKYEEHQKDLQILKKIMRENRKLYNKVFRTTSKYTCLYDLYVSNNKIYDEFKSEIIKLIEELLAKIDKEEYRKEYAEQIKPRLENKDFLPLITSKDNGRYPYQINKDELIKIIENQGKYYPFLKNKTKDNSYKIVKLLEFKIPYYVGPLVSSEKSKNAWLIRQKENVKITPYNFDEIIDKEKTAEEFIKRMISHCTYLLQEYALPNNSILYSEYKVMNELKQIRVNERKLTNSIQHKIIEELFKKTSGSITDRKMKNYLTSLKDYDMYNKDITITGYSAEMKFANTMQSYIDFFGENGIFKETNYTIEDAEKIIEWITIFEDKNILESKIKKEYPSLNEIQIKTILKKKYKGWGNLSKKLLTTKYYKDKETEIYKSIMDLMLETDKNFMQIINDDEYKFQEMIAEENSIQDFEKLDYSVVDALATSPATKKGIYQALKVVEEIVAYLKYEPTNISIEMARSNDKKERKDTRKKYLQKLYEKCKREIYNYKQLKHELDSHEITNEKLFLYFTQEGKCLYCGKTMNIEGIEENTELCEVDHILPRTLIKDDSMENKALVCRNCNQEKGARLVLPKRFQIEQNRKWWKKLKDNKQISAKKYNRLIRDTYKDEDIEGFINRQLVETRQIIKHVATILNNYHKDTNIIYLKETLSHYYRERYDLFKFREINDYHHAHDAYLAAVLGEYKEKYIKNKKITVDMITEMNNQIKDKTKELDKEKRPKLMYGFIINSLDENINDIVNNTLKNFIDKETGEIIFDVKGFNTRVIDTLYRNDILISKKTECKTGDFYNQTIQKKGSKGLPLKKNMPTNIYGSYTSINPSYATMINFTKKGKNNTRLVGFPIYLIDKKQEEIESYYRNMFDLSKDEKIELSTKKIPFYSYLNWDNQLCYLVGASNTVEVCNAKEFKYDKTHFKEYKYSLNRLFNKKEKSVDDIKYNKDLTDIIKYIVNKMETEYKLFDNLIPELKEIISYDNLEQNTLKEKEKIIIELTKLLNCRSENANFKFLNAKYSSAFGKKNNRIIQYGIVINRSTTGLKENCKELVEKSNEF